MTDRKNNTVDLRGVICFIGIGSNMQEPAKHCREAVERIELIEGVKVLRTSSLYRAEPVGFTDQDWFVNTVAEIRTMLQPRLLLEALKSIEKDMGRKESIKWGPRVIDLDILFYGQEIIQEESLIIPHPELYKRRFVLLPLCEIAAYVIHPAFGVSVRGLLDRLLDTHIVEIL
jgi:2-amino-4-hydroxy-6-hydroxymethyldihydropteridine diphosphokinase